MQKSLVVQPAVNLRDANSPEDYKRTGGILFANRNKGQRDENSATILPDKAYGGLLKSAGAKAVQFDGLSPATFIRGRKRWVTLLI